MAALFVLVLGDSNAEGFSFAYVLQMAMGVAVGFAVNWLVFPPLHLEGIDPATAGHQRALSQQLKDMARAMEESRRPTTKPGQAVAANCQQPPQPCGLPFMKRN